MRYELSLESAEALTLAAGAALLRLMARRRRGRDAIADAFVDKFPALVEADRRIGLLGLGPALGRDMRAQHPGEPFVHTSC